MYLEFNITSVTLFDVKKNFYIFVKYTILGHVSLNKFKNNKM